jgi:hypothetical protein
MVCILNDLIMCFCDRLQIILIRVQMGPSTVFYATESWTSKDRWRNLTYTSCLRIPRFHSFGNQGPHFNYLCFMLMIEWRLFSHFFWPIFWLFISLRLCSSFKSPGGVAHVGVAQFFASNLAPLGRRNVFKTIFGNLKTQRKVEHVTRYINFQTIQNSNSNLDHFFKPNWSVFFPDWPIEWHPLDDGNVHSNAKNWFLVSRVSNHFDSIFFSSRDSQWKTYIKF